MVGKINNKIIMALLVILAIVLIGLSIYFYYPDQLIPIAQALLIIFITLVPTLILILLSSFEMKDILWFISKSVLCLFLPIIVIVIGIIIGVENFNVNILDLPAVWYYIISVAWLSLGIVFFGAIN